MSDKTFELTKRPIGFIGLGFMGKPMARNLQAAGAKMIVHNRSPGPVAELVAEGMMGAATPAAARPCRRCEVTMQRDRSTAAHRHPRPAPR